MMLGGASDVWGVARVGGARACGPPMQSRSRRRRLGRRSLDTDGNNLLDFKEFQKAFLKCD
eukprot:3915293-Prymnesium_polylepis.3